MNPTKTFAVRKRTRFVLQMSTPPTSLKANDVTDDVGGSSGSSELLRKVMEVDAQRLAGDSRSADKKWRDKVNGHIAILKACFDARGKLESGAVTLVETYACKGRAFNMVKGARTWRGVALLSVARRFFVGERDLILPPGSIRARRRSLVISAANRHHDPKTGVNTPVGAKFARLEDPSALPL